VVVEVANRVRPQAALPRSVLVLVLVGLVARVRVPPLELVPELVQVLVLLVVGVAEPEPERRASRRRRRCRTGRPHRPWLHTASRIELDRSDPHLVGCRS
jgi:hypothetical protein